MKNIPTPDVQVSTAQSTPKQSLSSAEPGRDVEPQELQGLLRADGISCLLDVREPEEWAIVRFPSAHFIPTAQIPESLEQLKAFQDAQGERIVICRSGRRSDYIVQWLASQGLGGWRNLRGGIIAYAKEVDPSLPTY